MNFSFFSVLENRGNSGSHFEGAMESKKKKKLNLVRGFPS